MPLLFSYGTLQLESVQLATFGRRLDGHRDALPRYDAALVPIDDPALAASLGRTHHANVVASVRADARVDGTALDVTDEELARADAYEAPFAYERIRVTLASGADAWVYVHVGE